MYNPSTISPPQVFHLPFSALVERVFLRIGSAESDEQLEAALGRFLAPVLLKLDSKEEGVRKKVFRKTVFLLMFVTCFQLQNY